MSDETERLREAQKRDVMPIIGSLLDAWIDLPLDLACEMRDQAPDLVENLQRIESAMDNAE